MTADRLAMHGQSVIDASELRRDYGDGDRVVPALRGANVQVRHGEIVALSGPSGSGKTTLLNCLVGLDSPTSGEVCVLGQNLLDLSYEERVDWRREHVAIVFQTTGLLRHLSAAENVDIVLRIRGLSRSERNGRVAQALADLGLADFSAHRPGELSGGQQQRVSLARAIAARPALLIADEPTGQLDSETTSMVTARLYDAARHHGITMVMATHDRAVESMADRVVRMVDGVAHESNVSSARAET